MIQSVTITNYLGDTMTMRLMSPDDSGVLIKSITGLGPVEAEISTSDYAVSDGVYFNSARFGSRNIVFDIYYLFKPTIEEARHRVYAMFPVKRMVKMVFKTDTRTVYATGYVETHEPDIFNKLSEVQISVICPDPYFYSEASDRTMFSGVDDLFEFPFENNSTTEKLIEIGNIFTDTIKNIYYEGDSEVGMTVRVHALTDVTSITLYNLDTREQMLIDLTKLGEDLSSKMIALDDLIIVTSQGQKSLTLVREGTSHNALNCLDRSSTWLTLHKGDNVFAYIINGGIESDDDVIFEIENSVAYEGV